VRPLLLYEELDDKARKKLQMTTENVERISETLGANLGVLIIAGGEPFTRKDLPEIAKAFYTNNKLDAIVLMSNGQIQQRILPDVTRILDECPNLNVTVALGIDGLKEDHESIRQKPGAGILQSTPRASCRQLRRNSRGSISRRAPAS
jgi:Predicted Fe-S oxidoreductases